MTLTLRQRIILTLLPLLILLAVLGGAGIVLLYRLGNNIDAILRENYDSVIAMERLNESLERIDSSFQFALAGRQEKAHQQYQENWLPYRENLRVEQNNITIPGEGELVGRLTALTERYRNQGDDFFARPGQDPERHADYFGPGGLLETFNHIKVASGQILRLNQDNMENASRAARRFANYSRIWFAVGLGAAVILAVFFAWHTIRTILRPIQAMTHAATGISTGNLDQVVPYLSGDELGDLARAFNKMGRYLRDYRQSHLANLLRAQRTSQASIDSFSDPVLVIDALGGVEMANPAARAILGLAVDNKLSHRDQVHGQSAEPAPTLWNPPEPLRQPLIKAIEEQRPYQPEGFDHAIALRVNAREHFFLPRILPIRDPYGNSLGAAVLLQDITRFRLLDEVKSDLIATVSHELKTPLTSVRLALHLLLEEMVGPLTPKQTELLLDARDNAELLLDRVNNLLDLTRLEQGRERLDLHPEMPLTILQRVAETARPRAEDKRIVITVEAPHDLPQVAVDMTRLGRAMDNLLDNAITYTDRGGRISLSATRTDDTVIFSVADTGIGIPPEYLPRVFERFFRVPGQSKNGGAGLGLAIVREIIVAHGGSVSCASNPGNGSVFFSALPIFQAHSNTTGQPPLTSYADSGEIVPAIRVFHDLGS